MIRSCVPPQWGELTRGDLAEGLTHLRWLTMLRISNVLSNSTSGVFVAVNLYQHLDFAFKSEDTVRHLQPALPPSMIYTHVHTFPSVPPSTSGFIRFIASCFFAVFPPNESPHYPSATCPPIPPTCLCPFRDFFFFCGSFHNHRTSQNISLIIKDFWNLVTVQLLNFWTVYSRTSEMANNCCRCGSVAQRTACHCLVRHSKVKFEKISC